MSEEQIKATVIAHSKSSVTGKEIFTFELEFNRIVLAEFNTHNAISKNSSSSRAIPVDKMLRQVRENTAYPVRFGAANKGMQDAGEFEGLVGLYNDYLGDDEEYGPEDAWRMAASAASYYAEQFHKAGYAKQICNRLIEPFQMMKVVATATEWENFLWLRDHKAADPTIERLAQKIKEVKDNSVPVVLEPGEWHTPYYGEGYWKPDRTLEIHPEQMVDIYGKALEHALSISTSCCAQVSFRDIDNSEEKAKRVSANLNLRSEQPDEPVHASPSEHQATPFISPDHESMILSQFINDHTEWEEGVTHVDRDGQLGSGNLKSWKQYRQTISNNVKRG